MKYSILGYKDISNDKNEDSLIIPSNIITMKGVSRPLTLVPIINGKPLYSKKIIAKPGDPDINFGNDVEGVLELPYAQIGMMTNPMFLNAFNGILNTPNAPQNHPITFDDLTKKSTKTFYPEYNPYTGDKGTPTVVNGIESISNNNPINTTLSDSELKAKIDPNALQKILAEDTKSELDRQDQKGNPFIGAINPYSGWNMNNASAALGAFAGMKVDPNSENAGKQRTAKTLGIIGSAGKILLEGARNAFSGAGGMKVYQESLAEQQKRLGEQQRKQTMYYAQKGGEISNKEGLLSTGNFIYGNDNHPNPNVEIEKGEYIQTPDGSTMEVLGKKHSEGGEMLNLPQSTTVISDYLKIGSKLATYFKKNYDLNVTSKSTFATVIDRYKRKIGLTKILEEETGILQKITDQEDVEFEPTRDINLQILSKKAVELQSQKQPLEKRLEEFTRVVFDKQELQKGNEVESSYKQEGGDVENVNQDANQIEQLILMFSKITNQDPKQIIEQLQQLPDDQLQNAIQEISKVVQQAMNEQQGNNPQEEQQEGVLSNPQEEQQEQMKTGGTIDEKKWLSEKIAKHIRDGRPKDQAIAIAYRQAEEKFGHKFQKGGYILSPSDKASFYNKPLNTVIGDSYDFGLNSMTPWINSRMTDPSYGANDLVNIGNRFSDLAKQRGISFDPELLKTKEGLNKLAGLVQQHDKENDIDLANDYSRNIWATRQGLNTLVKSPEYMNNLKKQNIDVYNKLVKSLASDKTVKRGSYDTFSPDDRKIIMSALNNTSDKLQKQFTDSNYFDNEAFFRGVDKQSFVFNNEEEFNKWKKENENIKIGNNGYYKTDKTGVYVKPILIKDQYFKDEKERDNYIKNKKIYNDSLVEEGNDIYINPIIGEASKSNDIDPTKGIDPLQNRQSNFNTVLPIAVPDQSNLPPNYIPTSMREVKHVQANTINISPEATLGELANQAKTASKVLVEANPYTSAAGVANLQANENQAINQAYMQSEMANQQDQRNVENINEQRIQQRDNTNLNLASQYEKEAVVGAANLYDEWRNFITNKNQQNLVNYNLQNQVNAYNAMNPNYQIGTLGEIHQTDESPIFYTTINGQKILMDKQGNTYEKKIKTDSNGKTTTEEKTTSKSKKKKGGFITSDNLSNFLKSINK